MGPNHAPPSSNLRGDRRGFRGPLTRIPRHRIYIFNILLKDKYGVTMVNRRTIQKTKRSKLFLQGPVYFNWIEENIPDPTSHLILVAQAFMRMSKPQASDIALTAKIWDCARIESHDQRSRVLKKIDQRCEGYWVERRDGRTAVLHQGTNPMKLYKNNFAIL